MHTNGKLRGKTALVTGGGRGIGFGCARELAAQGASIVLNDRPGSPDLDGAVQEIQQLGVTCRCVEADVFERKGCEKLLAAVDRIVLRKGSGRRIAAFSSVGPIFVAFQRAVECPDAKALAVGWRLWNCSLTEFIFTEDRFTLERFNALPHLLEREEWTHR